MRCSWLLPTAVIAAVLMVGCSESEPVATPEPAAEPETAPVASVDPEAVTTCDELAGHPQDPRKVTEGRSSGDIDLPEAVARCRESVSEQPDNPRLNYQLGRVLTYSGEVEEALPYLQAAADQDYPQAVFVVGYLYAQGELVEQDLCRAAEHYHRAAKLSRQAALVAYPHHVLRGDFDECDTAPDREALRGFLETAKEAGDGYYQGLLIERLTDQLGA